MADVVSLSENQARFLRLRAQRLVAQPADGVAAVARALCGLQAQDMPAATLGVRARSTGLVAADVQRAVVEERSVVRTWAMRGTLHLLTTEDLGWLLSLLGPAFIAASQRRSAELGLDEETCTKGVRAIRDVLASRGPLTRPELVEYLAARAIRTEGQAKAYLVYRAALEGFICFGPDHGSRPTYVLLDDWIKRKDTVSLSREEACAELARRYLAAYGPAGPEDFAAWSGLAISAARAAWRAVAGDLVEVTPGNHSRWLLKKQIACMKEMAGTAPIVCLLPAFDTYLLGYQDRSLAVAPEYSRRINAGGGMVHAVLVVNGQVMGTWQSRRLRDGLEMVIAPFQTLATEAMPGLEAEIEDVARFLGTKATLQVRDPSAQARGL